jgi:hypothetical protein
MRKTRVVMLGWVSVELFNKYYASFQQASGKGVGVICQQAKVLWQGIPPQCGKSFLSIKGWIMASIS